MESKSSFLIGNPAQIISHLSLLFNNKCLISANFGDNNDSFITTIIKIDKKNHSLILDYAPKEYLSQQALNSANTIFKTEYLGIKVTFPVTRLIKTQYEGGPAFIMPIPEVILWIQRREFYRVKSPVSKSSYCRVLLENREPIDLKLYDISLSGFSMLNEAGEISHLLVLNAQFDQCRLVLAEADEDTVSFEIRNVYLINPVKLNKIEKIGCKFTHITSAFESAIQRYMQKIERENKFKT
ncbi:Flagellar brake protein YcgR [Candidatus Methylobacter favarea]|uniref:Flagellar brake protein YcgR n=1 Tax=Candidatus Methylobacter favarea TaxID=2707345 RepID=A0A8S0W9F3_9GAMM|nr:flagellar brake protein [Candidatus Methylobacter favarea]CAA9889926.1 Flagellar brake protein YcgR [Candidatus Methylobacter favarea]